MLQKELEKYKRVWQQRFKQEKKDLKKRQIQARRSALTCAHFLINEYGVSKVYLFGSLKSPSVYHRHSDIDLAVEGLKSSKYFKALAKLWKIIPAKMELDLVPLEDAKSELRKRILEEGELICEKK